MKWIRTVGNVVREVIPIEATVPDIAHWYGIEFANHCAEVPDDVEQGWVRGPNGVFIPPQPQDIPMDPLLSMQLAIAELAEAQVQDSLNMQLAIAELAESVYGGV